MRQYVVKVTHMSERGDVERVEHDSLWAHNDASARHELEGTLAVHLYPQPEAGWRDLEPLSATPVAQVKGRPGARRGAEGP